MKKIFFAIALFISLFGYAQKTVTIKVPQSSGFNNVTLLPGQVLTYNGSSWVGVTQYTETDVTNIDTSYATSLLIPNTTGIVNVYVFIPGRLANCKNGCPNPFVFWVTLPAASANNGRTIVLKPSYLTTGTTFAITTVDASGKIDNIVSSTKATAYYPNNGGTEFNITLVSDGKSWWVTSTR